MARMGCGLIRFAHEGMNHISNVKVHLKTRSGNVNILLMTFICFIVKCMVLLVIREFSFFFPERSLLTSFVFTFSISEYLSAYNMMQL